MRKVILHIDLNAFFIRCEEIKNPSLIGKPVIVGGDGRKGIISTASYEARKYGINSGMPTFQAKMLCNNLIILPGDYNFYELMSKEFVNYLHHFTQKVEQVSIDECFLDATNEFIKYGNNDIYGYCKKIQDGLFKKTKLKCSIGVATTKFLAKMASDYKKPMGITIIRKNNIKELIFPLKIGSFYGIGKKSAPKFESIGIKTIGQLYYAIKDENEEVLSIVGNMKDMIIDNLEENSSDEVNTEHVDPKSIGVTRTLDNDSNDSLEIKKFLIKLVKIVVLDMKSKDFLTKTITITYKDAEFNNGFKSYSSSYSFDNYTDDLDEIILKTEQLFKKTYKHNTIRLIGFSVKNLNKQNNIIKQLTIEESLLGNKEDEVGNLINDLNRKTNKKTFIRLSELKEKQ